MATTNNNKISLIQRQRIFLWGLICGVLLFFAVWGVFYFAFVFLRSMGV